MAGSDKVSDQEASGAAPGWLERLRRSRERLRGQLLLGALATSLAAPLSVYLGLELFRYLAALTDTTTLHSAVHSVLAAVAVLVLGATWSLYRAWLCTPRLPQVAQLADRRYSLDELLTTAIEVHGSEAPRNAPERALLHRAAGQGKRLEPRELAPIRLPQGSWPVLSLLLAVLALQLLPEPTVGASPPIEEGAVALSQEDRQATGAKVRRVAELVGRDAESKRDPYLQAVARSFEQLGEQVERGELDRAGLDQELDRLLSHLGRAMGEDDDLASELLAPLGSPAGEREGGAQADAEGQGEPAFESTGPEGAAPERGAASAELGDEGEGSSGQELPAGLDEILSRLEARLEPTDESGGEGRTPQAAGQADQNDNTGFYGDVDPELMAALEERREELARRRAERGEGGRPAGAAEESNEGPGDLAGEGAQPLGRGADDEFPEDGFADSEEVMLPEAARESGRKIQVELPPDAEFTAVDERPQGEGGDWRRNLGAASQRGVIGMMDRGVVSRYFLPAPTSDETSER